MDPGSGAFLVPGYGIGKKIRIWNEQPGSYFQKLINHFFGFKIFKFVDVDPGWKKFGSGINIPDPQHWFPTYFVCRRPAEARRRWAKGPYGLRPARGT